MSNWLLSLSNILSHFRNYIFYFWTYISLPVLWQNSKLYLLLLWTHQAQLILLSVNSFNIWSGFLLLLSLCCLVIFHHKPDAVYENCRNKLRPMMILSSREKCLFLYEVGGPIIIYCNFSQLSGTERIQDERSLWEDLVISRSLKLAEYSLSKVPIKSKARHGDTAWQQRLA